MESHATDGPGAELQQVTGVLRHALAEVCGTELKQANTGELQRFEEVLGVAGEAAKQVVAIRRARKATPRSTAQTPRAEPSAASAEELPSHRVFTDEAGIQWDAFAVHPSAEGSGKARLPEPYQHGWLSFDSGGERRRLSPIPEGWQEATVEALARMCERAEPAPRRATPVRPAPPQHDA